MIITIANGDDKQPRESEWYLLMSEGAIISVCFILHETSNHRHSDMTPNNARLDRRHGVIV